MKTAYETKKIRSDGELKKNVQNLIDRLRKRYTDLDAHRKALRAARKNKDGVSSQKRKRMCIALKMEIKSTKQAIAQIRDEFQQWMNGLPVMA
jgi:predicted  nucleic acid-binding Zn-ribbon protein